MIDLISVSVAPRRGRAQKGWIVLVSTSPSVRAIVVRLKAPPDLFAGRIMKGKDKFFRQLLGDGK